MNTRCLVISLLFAVPTGAFAQGAPRYECVNGDLQRRVEVIYETAVTVPCEVHYTKNIEAPGDSQVLWRALNEEGYCEAKASEFVAKLEGWGWACSAGARPETEAEPPLEDDTSALTPSEDTEPPEGE